VGAARIEQVHRRVRHAAVGDVALGVLGEAHRMVMLGAGAISLMSLDDHGFAQPGLAD
jgi:hypothetical protein